jgi:alkylation response protein AidB-like acyl-CoA dehydrogenase
MDFDFTDDQEMLRDTVRRWVERGYDFERRRGIVKAGGFAREAWQEIADLGICGLQVPEAQGGLGLGPVDAMVVQEELGRGLVLEPYAAVALVATSLLRAGHEAAAAPRLQHIAEGKEIVVLAHEERRSRYRLAHVETTAHGSGHAWRLSGRKIAVPAGGTANAFIVPARVSGGVDDVAGIGLFLVSPGQPGVEVRAYPTQDGASGADLVLKEAAAIELVAPGRRLRRARARGRHRHRCALRRGGRRHGQAGRDHGRVHEHAQAVRRSRSPASRRCAIASPTSRCSSSWRAR